jgi:hypothetical protein
MIEKGILKKLWVNMIKPYYSKNDLYLYLGINLEVLPTLKSNSVDLFLQILLIFYQWRNNL